VVPEAPRDRRGARVVAPGLSIEVAVGGIPDVREHPGAEDGAESGKTSQNLGVRVSFKGILEDGDLLAQGPDHRHQRADVGGLGLGHERRRGQLWEPERRADPGGPPLEVALPAATAQG
jgi:hypothetical protein